MPKGQKLASWLVAAAAALLLAASVGYLAGDSGSDATAPAATAAEPDPAGSESVEQGAKQGYEAGFDIGRKSAFESSFSNAYRRAFEDLLEAAGQGGTSDSGGQAIP